MPRAILTSTKHQAFKHWSETLKYLKGAASEDVIAKELNKLKRRGWFIAHDIDIGYGNIDHAATSPTGLVFSIDTKSHEGLIIYRGGFLSRKVSGRIYRFAEGDLLKKCRMQGVLLKRHLKCQWVQPILCFEKAKLSCNLNGRIVNGVLIVNKANLIKTLNKYKG